MKSRHRAREVALQILYQYDLGAQAATSPGSTGGKAVPVGQGLVTDLKYHFEHFTVPDSLREFAAQLVSGTLHNLETLDPVLEKHTSNWKVTRMSTVDRCLLRMALYEMLNFPEVPHSVVIDEAVELAKQFGTSETPAFINGVLDSIKASLATVEE